MRGKKYISAHGGQKETSINGIHICNAQVADQPIIDQRGM